MTLKTFFAIVCVLCVVVVCVRPLSAELSAEAPAQPVVQSSVQPSVQPPNASKIENHAFTPGEKLTYAVSWSNIVDAGIAVMEVKFGSTGINRGYHLLTSTRTVGVLEAFYPVRESIESVVDADGLYSLSYSLKEIHGEKKRRKEITFDYAHKKVRVAINDDQPIFLTVPGHMQDALSSLYYVRAINGLVVGKSVFVDVIDGDKIWSVEVQTLGKERIKTPVGEFDTIKVKTYPKYEGVFMNKGEIYIWLTDDAKRIPVLMKSIITIGSIVANLTHIEDGKNKP
jgi:hypothetical protein